MKIYTCVLVAPTAITITAAMNVMQMSVACNDSGAGTITGDQPIAGLPVLAPAPLNAGEAFGTSATASASPLQGITITCTSGTMSVALSLDL